MKAAIVGMPQSGKSTLASAISSRADIPPSGNRVHECVVPVPDERLDWLTGIYNPKKTVYAQINALDNPAVSFMDEPSRKAAKKLLTELKTADMFVLVVRAFKNETVPPYKGSVDPLRDISELLLEFLMLDLEFSSVRVERLTEQLKKGASKNKKEDELELERHTKLKEAFEAERPAATVLKTEEEREWARMCGLLTLKPFVVVINTDEDDLNLTLDTEGVVDPSVQVLYLCAKLEHELSQLDAESRAEFMHELDIREPASHRFVKSCCEALGLISFLTVGPDEVRAWPIRKGIKAKRAAGKVHSDVERGFIRAEVISYSDMKELGSEKAVKAAGKMRIEGKDYTVQDGDIINFRFNV